MDLEMQLNRVIVSELYVCIMSLVNYMSELYVCIMSLVMPCGATYSLTYLRQDLEMQLKKGLRLCIMCGHDRIPGA